MESKAYVPAPFKCYPVTATRLSLDSCLCAFFLVQKPIVK